MSREDALRTRSQYSLSRDIVDNVLMAAPILKSVHDGTDSSPIEMYASRAPWSCRATERGFCLLTDIAIFYHTSESVTPRQ